MSDETREEIKQREYDGVFVVMEFGYSTPVVVGVAESLHAAMLLTLDAGGFEMLVPAEDGWTGVPAESSDERARRMFRWEDESQIGNHPGYFSKGEGCLTAYFQNEGTPFRAYWRDLDTRNG